MYSRPEQVTGAPGGMDEYTRAFLQGIMEDAKMDDLDPEMMEDMIRELGERLENYILGTILDHLSDRDANTLVSMSEHGASKPEIEGFLKAKIPDVQAVMAQAYQDFRTWYLG